MWSDGIDAAEEQYAESLVEKHDVPQSKVAEFLYEHTTYSQDCARVLPLMATRMATPMGSWQAAWRYVKTHESPYIKAQAVLAAGGIPAVWPWLCDSKEERPQTVASRSPLVAGTTS